MPEFWVNEFGEAMLVPPVVPQNAVGVVPHPPKPPVLDPKNIPIGAIGPGEFINAQAGKAWDKAILDEFVQKHVKKPMKINPNLDNGFKVQAPVIEDVEKKKVNVPPFDPVTAKPDRIPYEVLDAVLLLLDENKEVPLLLKRAFVFMHYHISGRFVDFDKALETARKVRQKETDIKGKTAKMALLYKDEAPAPFPLEDQPPEEF
jgi:hypothetical protein